MLTNQTILIKSGAASFGITFVPMRSSGSVKLSYKNI
jgi:hypothetical protein